LVQAEDSEARLRDARRVLQADREEREAIQKSLAVERDDIATQGAALVDMGKQVICNVVNSLKHLFAVC